MNNRHMITAGSSIMQRQKSRHITWLQKVNRRPSEKPDYGFSDGLMVSVGT
ncbi:hypothetical protein [Neisseria elongata]|uniref:hypothetical protein n=1 Tax=Neisseria elongata TaxID=495 RepID=UPI003615181B